MLIPVNPFLQVAPAAVTDLSASFAFEEFSSCKFVLRDLRILWVRPSGLAALVDDWLPLVNHAIVHYSMHFEFVGLGSTVCGRLSWRRFLANGLHATLWPRSAALCLRRIPGT